jgi:hypothetical protein
MIDVVLYMATYQLYELMAILSGSVVFVVVAYEQGQKFYNK